MFSPLGISRSCTCFLSFVVVAVPGVNFRTSYQNEVGDAIKTSPLAREPLIGFGTSELSQSLPAREGRVRRGKKGEGEGETGSKWRRKREGEIGRENGEEERKEETKNREGEGRADEGWAASLHHAFNNTTGSAGWRSSRVAASARRAGGRAGAAPVGTSCPRDRDRSQTADAPPRIAHYKATTTKGLLGTL